MIRTKVISIALLLVSTLLTYGQDPNRKHSFGLYQSFTDYNVRFLEGDVFALDSAVSSFTRIAYQRRLSHNWMLNTGITNGFIFNQNVKDSFINKGYVFGADASVMLKLNNGKLIRENARIGPFISFGYRLDYIHKLIDFNETPWVMSSQFGAGLNIKLLETTHIQIQAALDQKLLADFNSHFQYRIGITQSFGKNSGGNRNRMLDSDYDGIIDIHDNCPGLYGLEEFDGCPDTAFTTRWESVDSLEKSLLAKEMEVIDLKRQLSEKIGTYVRVDTIVLETVLLKTDTVYLKENETVTTTVEPEKILGDLKFEDIENNEDPEEETIPADKNYYVITFSSTNLRNAQNWHRKMLVDFPEAVILPQPNGYYRVGVFAGKDKQKGLEILKTVKLVGLNTAWLSVE